MLLTTTSCYNFGLSERKQILPGASKKEGLYIKNSRLSFSLVLSLSAFLPP